MDNGESSCRRFLEGDKSAFDDVMRAHFDHVVLFADRILHDTYLAEDVAIDVFAYLAFKKGWDGRSSLRTYLLTVARSRALNALKKRKSRGEVAYEDLSEDEEQREQLEDEVLRDERKRVLAGAMKKLPPEMATVLHLIYWEELSYEECARVMDKSKKQVDNLLYRAKNALRDELGEEGRALI